MRNMLLYRPGGHNTFDLDYVTPKSSNENSVDIGYSVLNGCFHKYECENLTRKFIDP